VIDTQWAGLDPGQMGLGPVHAMAPLMIRNRLDSADVDYWEINEAFAAQVQACLYAWQDADYCRTEVDLEQAFSPIDEDRLNVDGGGVSIGHPVGASGARIVLHLLNVLKRTGGKRGIASLCIGGGQGGAMLVEGVH
jgi:acetyl-CoA C-acetyltransferase